MVYFFFSCFFHSFHFSSFQFFIPLSAENPYKCLTCSYSAITISQLKEHSLRVHGEMLTLPKLRAGAALRSPRPNLSSDPMTLTQEGEGKRQREKNTFLFADSVNTYTIIAYMPCYNQLACWLDCEWFAGTEVTVKNDTLPFPPCSNPSFIWDLLTLDRKVNNFLLLEIGWWYWW